MSTREGGQRKRPADSGVEGSSNSRRRIEADPHRENIFQHGRRDFPFRYVNCDYEASFFQHAEHSGDNGQTMTCAVQALNYYNEINGTSYQVKAALDSNAFDLGNDYKRNNETFFVHVNFVARDKKSLNDELFFAEIEGVDKPKWVTNCVPLDRTPGNKREDICSYCTGLQHPSTGGFTGFTESVQSGSAPQPRMEQ